MRRYLAHCQLMLERSQATAAELKSSVGQVPLLLQMIENYQAHALRQLYQVRLLLDDEKIPHEEKVFSIFDFRAARPLD